MRPMIKVVVTVVEERSRMKSMAGIREIAIRVLWENVVGFLRDLEEEEDDEVEDDEGNSLLELKRENVSLGLGLGLGFEEMEINWHRHRAPIVESPSVKQSRLDALEWSKEIQTDIPMRFVPHLGRVAANVLEWACLAMSTLRRYNHGLTTNPYALDKSL
ncbi:hypothetical protein MTR_7g406770 [Medicago truncatula]|uniref:Uncharacterized protein n=1 Tax=Medicago truncatula TaxID=3880 RepID=A0A072TWC8_MEDTR|nr:hypothetical protein MTR_7g406770 [Medicago truncatula]